MRLLRLSSGLTQPKWCKRVGLNLQAWNSHETGRQRISLNAALTLCRSYGVSLDWIYRGEVSGLTFGLVVQIDSYVRKNRAQIPFEIWSDPLLQLTHARA